MTMMSDAMRDQDPSNFKRGLGDVLNGSAGPSSQIVLSLADRFETGRIAWRLPKGGCRITGSKSAFSEGDAIDVTVNLNNERAPRRLLTGGNIGAGEAYMDGDFETDNLARFLYICASNVSVLEKTLGGSRLFRSAQRLVHLLNRNTEKGSRRNIQYHYDLGNEFYTQWLDRTMTYSSAEFLSPDEDLASAQFNKYERLAERLELTDSHHVLEVGCGWGGFAEHVAKHRGARVTGLTISDEQHAFASERMQREGLNEKVDIVKRDYRHETGEYDRVASIEMFEAVGEAYWPIFFDKVRDWLTGAGKAALQIITIDDDNFERYRANPDFIQRFIFPGGMLPSPGKLRQHIHGAGMKIEAYDTFGESYAATLAEWNANFQAAWDSIKGAPRVSQSGKPFDERFRRMWEYYLCYCEAGFRTGTIDVCRVAITK